MAAILNMSKYNTHLEFDIRYEKIIPNYGRKSFFIVMTLSMTSQCDIKSLRHIPVSMKKEHFCDNRKTNKPRYHH